jgi:hypothetical protein
MYGGTLFKALSTTKFESLKCTSVFTITDSPGYHIVGGRKLRIGKIRDGVQDHEMRLEVLTNPNTKDTVF